MSHGVSGEGGGGIHRRAESESLDSCNIPVEAGLILDRWTQLVAPSSVTAVQGSAGLGQGPFIWK